MPPLTEYPGPDKEFGEHADYQPGDCVWTYDNAPGVIVEVLPDLSEGRQEQAYAVVGPNYMGKDSRRRVYDASRLALVKRQDDFGRYLAEPCDEEGCGQTATHNGHSRYSEIRGKFCNQHIDWDKGSAHARDD